MCLSIFKDWPLSANGPAETCPVRLCRASLTSCWPWWPSDPDTAPLGTEMGCGRARPPAHHLRETQQSLSMEKNPNLVLPAPPVATSAFISGCSPLNTELHADPRGKTFTGARIWQRKPNLHYPSAVTSVHNDARALDLHFAPLYRVERANHRTPQQSFEEHPASGLQPDDLTVSIARHSLHLEWKDREKKVPLEPLRLIKKCIKRKEKWEKGRERYIWLTVNESYKMEMGNMCKHFKYFCPCKIFEDFPCKTNREQNKTRFPSVST